MSNFRKFISMSAVAVLAGTNLLAPLSYADAAAIAWASLDFHKNPLEFFMPDSDVYLYAVTEPNNYYVEFHGNTGTGTMERQTFTYDDPQNLNPNAFTKTWYTYSGWNTDANGGGSGYTNNELVNNLAETGTVDLYAQWNVNGYNIIYKLNDASGSSSWVLDPEPANEITYIDELAVANPSRTWYTFSGWDISGMDTEEHLIGWEPSHESSVNGTKATSFKYLRATSGTVEFLAQWSKALTEYKVKHYKQNTENDQYPETPTLTETLSGYTDTEAYSTWQNYPWFGDPIITKDPTNGNINADESTVITYQYPRLSYNLTLVPGRWVATVAADGTRNDISASSTTVTSGFKYEEPVVLSFTLKQWYTWGAWTGTKNNDSSFTMPHEAITKTASADVITYNIVYKCRNAATGCPADTTYTVESDDITIPDNLTRDHSVFQWWTGWKAPSYSDITEATEWVKIASWSTENREYSAVWDCVDWYHLNNTWANNETCEANLDTEYIVEHYQQQLDESYTIVSADTETLSGATDSPATWTSKPYVWFSGWYLSGGVTPTINWDPANKTVVKVYYDRNSYDYSVTHTTWVDVGVDATTIDGTKIKYGDEVTLSHTEEEWYEFESWTVTGPNGIITVTDNKFPMPAWDVTIKANLTNTLYDITYVLNSWSVAGTNPINYTVESEAIYLTDPTRPHSVFLWWSGGDHDGMFSWHVVAIAKWSTWPKTFTANWWCETWYHPVDNSCVANTYTATIDYNDGWDTATGTVNFEYGTGTPIPNPQQSWYKFVWWSITWMSGDAATVDGTTHLNTPNDTTSGTVFMNLTPENWSTTVKFEAIWEAEDVTYTVYHYTKALWEDTYQLEWSPVPHTGKSDDPVNFNNVTGTYEGFTYTGWHAYTTAPADATSPSGARQSSTTIDKHGNTKIYLYYDRNKWTVTTAHDTGVNNVTWGGTYEYGATVNVEAHVKAWYHFVQWTWTPAPAPTSVSGS